MLQLDPKTYSWEKRSSSPSVQRDIGADGSVLDFAYEEFIFISKAFQTTRYRLANTRTKGICYIDMYEMSF